MKKPNALPFLLAALTGVCMLPGCGSGAPSIKTVNLILPDDKGGTSVLENCFCLHFKKNSQVPYISLEDGVKFLNLLKAERFADPTNQKYYFRLSSSGSNPKITDERGNTVSFDLANQTFVYSDFDSFLTFTDEKLEPISIGGPAIRKKVVKSEANFTKGKAVTVDLKPYKAIELTTYEGKTYLPLTTFNDFL